MYIACTLPFTAFSSSVLSVFVTFPPCPGAALEEQGPHQHSGLYGSSERPAGDSSGSSKHPKQFKTQHINGFLNIFELRSFVICLLTEYDNVPNTKQHLVRNSTLTLCCSRALWTVLAVTSCACWTMNSCLSAPSASCSQAPTVSRGGGRDLSRWRCQSRSWKRQNSYLNKERNTFSRQQMCS